MALTPSIRLYEVKRVGGTCPINVTPSPFENPECANTVIASSNADDIANLFDNDFNSYATLRSGSNSLLGQLLGGQANDYSGFVELGFDETIDANKTAYMRIDFEPTLLNELLGGSLGGTLAGLVDNLLLGNHFFSIQAKMDNAIVLEGASNDNFGNNNERIRIVQDVLGRYYIAITPNGDYNRIRITDHTKALLPLTDKGFSMNVYGVCTDNPLTDCQEVFTTSWDGEGLTLSAAGLANSGVTNADHAININTDDYSEISLGVVAVGTSVKQFFDFRKLALPNEVVNLELTFGSGALNANLIGGLEIIAYNGFDVVATLDTGSTLINGLNVLAILNNGAKGIIPFQPGVPYDRVSVGLKGVVNVSVLPELRVFTVKKECLAQAIDDAATTEKETPVTIDVAANDIGMDKTTITITQPANGLAEINTTTNVLTYWPNDGFVGTDTFTYKICTDGTKTKCDTATVTITVVNVDCTIPINGEAFDWSYETGKAPSDPLTKEIPQPAADAGFVFDIYKMDNSFNMSINGTSLATGEMEFDNIDGGATINVRFQDGSVYAPGSIWNATGTEENPLVRVKIDADGNVSLFGSKTSGGRLYPLELFDGNSLNTIVWNASATNDVVITQVVAGGTALKGKGYGLNFVTTPTISIENIKTPVCDGEAIELKILDSTNAPIADGVYTLNYDEGIFKDVQVTGGLANIIAPIGVYENITIGEGTCISADGVDAEVVKCSKGCVISNPMLTNKIKK